MPTVTFYRQARRDGGTRTGIEIDGEVVLGRFEEGRGEFDPALIWYVDVESTGDSLPGDAEGAREWLTAHAEVICRNLRALADQLANGVDIDAGSTRSDHVPETGASITVRCSAARRAEGQHMGEILRGLADGWDERIRSLPAVEPIAR